MSKKIKDLSEDELEWFILERCKNYISIECYGCPLNIFEQCYMDIKDKLEQTIEVYK